MRPMKPSAADQPPATDTRQADVDANAQDRPPQIRSLITPGVASSPILPAWLTSRVKRLFKRPTPSH